MCAPLIESHTLGCVLLLAFSSRVFLCLLGDRARVKKHLFIVIELSLSCVCVRVGDESVGARSLLFGGVDEGVELFLLVAHDLKHFHLELLLLFFLLEFFFETFDFFVSPVFLLELGLG